MAFDPQELRDDAYRTQVFTKIVQDYQDRIYRYCIRRMGDAQGEEVAQEVFLTAWRTLERFRQESALSTWLIGIAKNKCIQAFRNRSRRQDIAAAFVDDIRYQSHAEEAIAPEHQLAEQDQATALVDGLNQLRDDDRLLINLRYYKDLPVSEIAELMGKSEAAVRKRLLRALQRLRQIMPPS